MTIHRVHRSRGERSDDLALQLNVIDSPASERGTLGGEHSDAWIRETWKASK